MKSIIIKSSAVIALILVGHFLILNPLIHLFEKKKVEEVSSTIVVEQVKKVLKLVTIEGNFSELMNYSDFETFDLPGFRKKAIVKVQGKVLYGFDLEHLQFNIDEENKIMTLKQLPKPQIIAVETDISYYDISEGLFNSFSESELSSLNKKAKSLIIKKAEESDLKNKASENAAELLELVNAFATNKGWTFRYNETNISTLKP